MRPACAGWPTPTTAATGQQTGERSIGIDAFIEIDRRYPGGLPDTGIKRLSGSEDRVLDNLMRAAPDHGLGRPVGRRDRRSLPGRVALDAGLDHGAGRRLVRHETQYFAPEEEAPAWRDRS